MKPGERERLLDEFESYDILHDARALDRVRGHLGDDEDGRPPELRDDLLRLHQLAMTVMNSESDDEVEALFNLAAGLDLHIFEIAQELEKVQAVLERLMELAPQLGDGDEDEKEN